LLIGNQAIDFRLEHEAEGWKIFDLGEEWLKATGLPFVFAVWALRRELPHLLEIAQELRALKSAGLARLDEIVQNDPVGTPELRLRYLTEHIVFDTGEKGRAAVAKYRELLTKHGAIAPSTEPLLWV
jgi:chorismate dehydratase